MFLCVFPNRKLWGLWGDPRFSFGFQVVFLESHQQNEVASTKGRNFNSFQESHMLLRSASVRCMVTLSRAVAECKARGVSKQKRRTFDFWLETKRKPNKSLDSFGRHAGMGGCRMACLSWSTPQIGGLPLTSLHLTIQHTQFLSWEGECLSCRVNVFLPTAGREVIPESTECSQRSRT